MLIVNAVLKLALSGNSDGWFMPLWSQWDCYFMSLPFFDSFQTSIRYVAMAEKLNFA